MIELWLVFGCGWVVSGCWFVGCVGFVGVSCFWFCGWLFVGLVLSVCGVWLVGCVYACIVLECCLCCGTRVVILGCLWFGVWDLGMIW